MKQPWETVYCQFSNYWDVWCCAGPSFQAHKLIVVVISVWKYRCLLWGAPHFTSVFIYHQTNWWTCRMNAIPALAIISYTLMQVIVDNQGHSWIPHVEKSDSVQKYSICTHWFAQSNMILKYPINFRNSVLCYNYNTPGIVFKLLRHSCLSVLWYCITKTHYWKIMQKRISKIGWWTTVL